MQVKLATTNKFLNCHHQCPNIDKQGDEELFTLENREHMPSIYIKNRDSSIVSSGLKLDNIARHMPQLLYKTDLESKYKLLDLFSIEESINIAFRYIMQYVRKLDDYYQIADYEDEYRLNWTRHFSRRRRDLRLHGYNSLFTYENLYEKDFEEFNAGMMRTSTDIPDHYAPLSEAHLKFTKIINPQTGTSNPVNKDQLLTSIKEIQVFEEKSKIPAKFLELFENFSTCIVAVEGGYVKCTHEFENVPLRSLIAFLLSMIRRDFKATVKAESKSMYDYLGRGSVYYYYYKMHCIRLIRFVQ